MKFSKQLKLKLSTDVCEWTPYYISYRDLKHILSCFPSVKAKKESSQRQHEQSDAAVTNGTTTTTTGTDQQQQQQQQHESTHNDDECKPQYSFESTQQADAFFIERLDAELAKINKFFAEKEDDCTRLYENLLAQVKAENITPDDTVRYASIRKQALELCQTVDKLVEYASLNFDGFRRILKKHDKLAGAGSAPLQVTYIQKVIASNFHSSHKLVDLQSKAERLCMPFLMDNFKADAPPPPAPSTEETVHVNDFENHVKSLPRNNIYHRWVILMYDKIGQPIIVPVMIAKGICAGPRVVITSTIHGNELNGIPVIHRLFSDLDVRELCGTIIAVVIANTPGFMAHTRTFDGADLNRLMPGKKNGTPSQIYAANLFKLVCLGQYHLDLHTASFGKLNCLYTRGDMTSPITARMAFLQNPQVILHNTGVDGTLRGAAESKGIKSITIEIGDPQCFQEERIRHALVGVKNIFRYLKMLHHEEEITTTTVEPVLCSRSYWIYTDTSGILEVYPDVATWVKKGELLARVKNVFGKTIKEYFAPEDGVIIGKNANPANQSGDRVVHIGIISDHFSAKST